MYRLKAVRLIALITLLFCFAICGTVHSQQAVRVYLKSLDDSTLYAIGGEYRLLLINANNDSAWYTATGIEFDSSVHLLGYNIDTASYTIADTNFVFKISDSSGIFLISMDTIAGTPVIVISNDAGSTWDTVYTGVTGGGEANTLSDTGTYNETSGFGLSGGKTGTALKAKGLIEGTNITIAKSGDSALTITASGGSGSIDSTGFGFSTTTKWSVDKAWLWGQGYGLANSGVSDSSGVDTFTVFVDTAASGVADAEPKVVTGNQIYDWGVATFLALTGGTMTGYINLGTDSIIGGTRIATDTIDISGDVIGDLNGYGLQVTGNVLELDTAAAVADAETKPVTGNAVYDYAIANLLFLTGGTMTGFVNMGTDSIIGLTRVASDTFDISGDIIGDFNGNGLTVASNVLEVDTTTISTVGHAENYADSAVTNDKFADTAAYLALNSGTDAPLVYLLNDSLMYEVGDNISPRFTWLRNDSVKTYMTWANNQFAIIPKVKSGSFGYIQVDSFGYTKSSEFMADYHIWCDQYGADTGDGHHKMTFTDSALFSYPVEFDDSAKFDDIVLANNGILVTNDITGVDSLSADTITTNKIKTVYLLVGSDSIAVFGYGLVNSDDSLKVDTANAVADAEPKPVTGNAVYDWVTAQSYLTSETDPVWVSDSGDYAMKTWVQTEIEDSLNEYSTTAAIQALIGDSLDEYSLTSLIQAGFLAKADSGTWDEVSVKVVFNQAIIGNASDSGVADSGIATLGYVKLIVEDSLNEYLLATGTAADVDSQGTQIAAALNAHDALYDNFSELAGTVGDAQIAAGAVDGGQTGEIADGTVDSFDIKDGSVALHELFQDGATDGQVIKWNNSGGYWEPNTDNEGDTVIALTVYGDEIVYGPRSYRDIKYKLDISNMSCTNADTVMNIPSYAWIDTTGSGDTCIFENYADSGFYTCALHPSVQYIASGWHGYKYQLVQSPIPHINDGGGDADSASFELPTFEVSNDGENFHGFIDSFSASPTYNSLTMPLQQASYYNKGGVPTYLADGDIMLNFNKHMWVCYTLGGLGTHMMVAAAYTSDGLTWNYANGTDTFYLIDTTIGAGNELVSPCWEIGVNRQYKLWVVYNHSNKDTSQIWLYESDTVIGVMDNDPIKITVPIINNKKLWHMDIKPRGPDEYVLLALYTDTVHGGNSTGSGGEIYVGTSTDGGHSFNINTTPVLSANTGDSAWDANFIYRATGYWLDEGRYTAMNVIYSARSKDNDWSIGQTVLYFDDSVFTDLDSTNITDGGVAEDDINWHYQWINLNTVHASHKSATDSIYLSFPANGANGDTIFLLRDSAGNITPTKNDTFTVSAMIPFDCVVDSLEIMYMTGAEIANNWIKCGPNGLADSVLATNTVDLTSATWDTAAYAITDKTVSAGYVMAWKADVAFGADNERLRIAWARLRVRR